MKHHEHSERQLLKPYSKVLYELFDKCYSIYDPHDDLNRNIMLCYKHPQFVISFESVLNMQHKLKLIVDGINIRIDMNRPFEECIEMFFESSTVLTKAEQSKVLYKAIGNLYDIIDDIQLYKVNQIPCLIVSSKKNVQDLRIHPQFKSMVLNRETTCPMVGYLGEKEVYYGHEDFNGVVTEVEMFSDKPPVKEEPRVIEIDKNPIFYF